MLCQSHRPSSPQRWWSAKPTALPIRKNLRPACTCHGKWSNAATDEFKVSVPQNGGWIYPKNTLPYCKKSVTSLPKEAEWRKCRWTVVGNLNRMLRTLAHRQQYPLQGIRAFKPLCGRRGPRTLGEMGDSSVSDMTPLSPCRTVPNNKSMHASPHAALTHSLDVTAKVQVLASNSTARSLSWQLASRRLTEPTLNNTTGWRFLIVWAEHVSKPHWVSLVEASWI